MVKINEEARFIIESMKMLYQILNVACRGWYGFFLFRDTEANQTIVHNNYSSSLMKKSLTNFSSLVAASVWTMMVRAARSY